MKIRILIITILAFGLVLKVKSQNYNSLNYNANTTPINGVKIRTNLPFTKGTQMPTIIIEGFNYGTSETIGLIINYYIWSVGPDLNDPANFYFHNPAISSFGGYTPIVYLANENGKVIIFLDQKDYHQRFTIRCFAQGMGEHPSWFQGWTAVDEPNNGTKTVLISYKNKFKGEVVMPGNGIWNSAGNVGIGTTAPKDYKLAVNGKIRTQEIKVENANWPDYVFDKSYQLPTLQETDHHIKAKGHLPGIPSAAEVKVNGIELGDMNAKLLQKIEELTLHLIRMENRAEKQQFEIDHLKSKLK